MGNLGGYQVITTVAKKVGGPLILIILILVIGFAMGAASMSLI